MNVRARIIHERRGERIVADLCAVFWLSVLLASYLRYGGEVWLTRLMAYGTAVFATYALAELVAYRCAVRSAKRASERRAMIGEQAWFWSSDHEPDDSSL